MKKKDSSRSRRSQRDYTMAFKLSVVSLVEKGEMTYKQAQKIKRLEKELADERLRNEILNTMIDISDAQYGTSIRKKFSPKPSGIFNKKDK